MARNHLVHRPIGSEQRCPCGTGLSFGDCCQRFHEGANAPTAETLMRSRFSAFVTGDEDYLLRTWDPLTRPVDLNLEDDSIRFYRLDILDTVDGSPLHDTGVVEFEAFYKGAAVGSQRERSTFSKSNGRWFYNSGELE